MPNGTLRERSVFYVCDECGGGVVWVCCLLCLLPSRLVVRLGGGGRFGCVSCPVWVLACFSLSLGVPVPVAPAPVQLSLF
jgi:hypothetical protein